MSHVCTGFSFVIIGLQRYFFEVVLYFLQNIIWGVGVLKRQGGCFCVYGVYNVVQNEQGGWGVFLKSLHRLYVFQLNGKSL